MNLILIFFVLLGLLAGVGLFINFGYLIFLLFRINKLNEKKIQLFSFLIDLKQLEFELKNNKKELDAIKLHLILHKIIVGVIIFIAVLLVLI